MTAPSEELSFHNAIDNQKLPIVLQATKSCVLGERTVLEEDQILTVLDRAHVDLVTCKDADGKTFKIAKDMVLHSPIHYVEEFYPRTTQELEEMISNVSYVQTKSFYKDNLNTFGPLEVFKFTSYFDENTIVLQTKSEDKFFLNVEVLLNSKLFVLVKINGNKKRFNDFLEHFESEQMIRLDDPTSNKMMYPNFSVESVGEYEVAYTVTDINNSTELKYETFPLDRRITFRRTGKKPPDYVEQFGRYNTESYLENLKQVKIAMSYDNYLPRFYGNLIIKNPYRTDLQRPNKLNLTNENKPSVRESLRRGFKNFIRSSPSKEDLRIPGIEKPQTVPPPNNFPSPTKHQALAPRSSSDAPRPIQKTVKKADTNPIYDIDTWKLEQLRQEFAKNKVDGVPIKPPRRRLPRPKSLDMDHLHSMFYNELKEDNLYEKPFNEKSPHGKLKHVKDQEIFQYQRSPSLPIRVPLQAERPTQRAHSTSPPSFYPPSSSFEGLDSGVDSPSDSRSLGEMLKRFQTSSPQPQPQQENRTRSHSAMEKRKSLSQLSLSGSDLNISYPFNFKHQKGHGIPENLYAIPGQQRSSFNQLDETNQFPDLDQITQNTRRNTAFRSHIYESVIYADVKNEVKGNPIFAAEVESMNSIKAFLIDDVKKLLTQLKLERHVQTFEDEMVTGYMLVEKFTEFHGEMGLTPFEARKLYKYVRGWRPTILNSGHENMNFKEWSINEVEAQLIKLKLPMFAIFCSDNLIDGALLLDMIQNKLLTTLEQDKVTLKKVEIARIEAYFENPQQYEHMRADSNSSNLSA